jgi:hypothetical protein
MRIAGKEWMPDNFLKRPGKLIGMKLIADKSEKKRNLQNSMRSGNTLLKVQEIKKTC